MTKLKVELELEIPFGLLFYDLGTKSLCCKVCGNKPPANLDSGISVHHTFTAFINTHAACVFRHNEEQRRIADSINSTRGGPGDR